MKPEKEKKKIRLPCNTDILGEKPEKERASFHSGKQYKATRGTVTMPCSVMRKGEKKGTTFVDG